MILGVQAISIKVFALSEKMSSRFHEEKYSFEPQKSQRQQVPMESCLLMKLKLRDVSVT
jgi:hypothetical protein